MIGYLKNEEYKEYEEIFKYRQERFSTLLEIEGNLMEFGGFTWADAQKLKVIERRYHIKRIKEKLEKQGKI